MYFKDIPQVYYDFDINGTRQLKVMKDITHNVRFRKEVLANVTLYDSYDIRDGETPEIIAEKIYGNPNYHWVIMLANEKYDYLNDFPLSTYYLEQHLRQKYGNAFSFVIASNISNTTSIVVSSTANLKVGYAFIYTPTGSSTSVTTYITSIPSSTRFIVKDSVSSLATGSVVNVDPVYATHHYVDNNGFIVDSSNVNATSVSNYQYEDDLNESKRRIKIIAPELLNTILKNYKDLI